MGGQKTVKSIAELEQKAADFVLGLQGGEQATVIGLYGELGAGKTAFVKAIAKALGLADPVTSPTFVIEKIYKTEKGIFKYLIHIDAYRLEGSGELEVLGWEEIMRDPNNLIFIEWADKVENILPKDAHKIYFTFIDENTRSIEYKHAG